MNRIYNYRKPDMDDLLNRKRQEEYLARAKAARQNQEPGKAEDEGSSRKQPKKAGQAEKAEKSVEVWDVLKDSAARKTRDAAQRTWPVRMDEYIRGDSCPPEEEAPEKAKEAAPEKTRPGKAGEAAPEKAGEADPEKAGPEKTGPENPEKAAPEKAGKKRKAERCVGNTDEVEREIRKLKKRKQQLEQQIAQSGDSPDRQQKLQKELDQVENELKQKDTDSYRRQHTKFTRL